jgi:hypothetical protein
MEILSEANLFSMQNMGQEYKEALELVKIFASVRKTLSEKKR